MTQGQGLLDNITEVVHNCQVNIINRNMSDE